MHHMLSMHAKHFESTPPAPATPDARTVPQNQLRPKPRSPFPPGHFVIAQRKLVFSDPLACPPTLTLAAIPAVAVAAAGNKMADTSDTDSPGPDPSPEAAAAAALDALWHRTH